jgi:hypothetical protein
MSLTLVFGRPVGGPGLCGPYQRLYFRGAAIFADEHPEPVARHERHRWLLLCQRHEGPHFTRIDIHGVATLHFQRKAAEVNYGPYSSLSLVNGVLYVDSNVFGFEDAERHDWYCTQDRAHWDEVIVRPAEA